MQPSTFRFSCLPVSRVECLLQLPSLDIVFSSKRAEDELLYSEFGDGAPNAAATAVGGLSVTSCLSDFSVYVFHPYGGKKSTLRESQWSPLSDSERKDSLSVNVEFVKFHLSRSRMLNFKQESSKGKGGDSSRAVIRFSSKKIYMKIFMILKKLRTTNFFEKKNLGHIFSGNFVRGEVSFSAPRKLAIFIGRRAIPNHC